ncbi:MAG: hypothetical protein AAGF85_19585 [Bacteroidota bacterium]
MLKYLSFIIIVTFLSCTATKNNDSDQPKMFSGPVLSCGNASIFQLNKEKDSYILIQLDMTKVEVNKKVKIGSLGTVVKHVKFDGDVSNVPCNDIMYDDPKKSSEEKADKGTLELTISAEELEKKNAGNGYRISVKSSDITFPDGSVFEISVRDAYVGWLPG